MTLVARPQSYVDAIAASTSDSAGGAAAAPVEFDASLYPEKLGKYWLGPIDPTRPHDEPQGSYGLVKAGIDSQTGERVCCKLSHLEHEGSEAQRMEIILQAGLKHDNIVDLKDIVYEKPVGRPRKQLCMIMELLSGGELFSEVVDNGGLSEDQARFYFRQILLGMAYCHARKLVHRDIKLENLLLTGDKQLVKIADFGLAKNVSEDAAKTVIGTAKYVAPEMLAGAEYDGFKSDIWSCGVCLYCMTECRFPFTKAGNDGVGGHGVHQTTAGNLRLMRDLQDAKYVLKPDRSPEYVAFLARLLQPDVGHRYTAAEALMDPWILAGDCKPKCARLPAPAPNSSLVSVLAGDASKVEGMLGGMDSSSVVVVRRSARICRAQARLARPSLPLPPSHQRALCWQPAGYQQSEWVEQVKRVMEQKGATTHTHRTDASHPPRDSRVLARRSRLTVLYVYDCAGGEGGDEPEPADEEEEEDAF